MIDWTQIIITIISIFTGGGITAIAMLKYTKSKAKTEANSAANQEQSERIDLGDKYVNQMLSMLEKLQEAQDRSLKSNMSDYKDQKESIEKISRKVIEIHDDLVGVKDEVSSIVQYLNGGYAEFKQVKSQIQ